MVPKLRFKEFCGEWEEKRLGDIAEIYKGNVLSKSDLRDEGHPCILYGELYTKYGEIIEKVYSKTNRADKNLFIGKINDVLIPSSGETAIDISTASCLKCDNVYIGGDLNVIRCNNVNGSFLSYTLNHKQRNSIAKFAQGVSVVHLYGDSLRKLKINIPSLPEQTKIAHFLCTVDDKIQNQQDKITHLENIKKGFMQKIFSKKIRFKDDGGEEFPEWEKKKLGDICKIIGGGTPDTNKPEYWGGDIPWFTPSEIGVEKYISKSERTITEEGLNKSSAKILPKGTILLSSRATIGEMSITKVECCTNQGFQSLVIDSKNSNEYIYYLQDKIRLYSLKNSYGSTFLEINKSNLAKCKVPIPCLKEQQKIADFLSSFDEKISTEKEILEHLKQLKKGLLQQMFV